MRISSSLYTPLGAALAVLSATVFAAAASTADAPSLLPPASALEVVCEVAAGQEAHRAVAGSYATSLSALGVYPSPAVRMQTSFVLTATARSWALELRTHSAVAQVWSLSSEYLPADLCRDRWLGLP